MTKKVLTKLFLIKAISIIIIIIIIFLQLANWGSNRYGSYFTKLHFRTDFFVEVCDDKNVCSFFPADIEVYKNWHRDYTSYVYLQRFNRSDNYDVNFVAKNKILGLSLSLLDLVLHGKNGLIINGCFLGYLPQKQYQTCIDSDGKIWKIRLPYTNEVNIK